jgi:UDP-N-acetylglucosamine 2-epimerase (non-hydrolysing)
VSEPSGLENLNREGVDSRKVHFVGNVMIDTLLAHRERASASEVLGTLGVEPRGYAVLTLHRPSNVDDARVLRGILDPVLDLSGRIPVIFPVHPRALPAVGAELGHRRTAHALRCIEPLGYLDFLRLMSDARLVLTDSGGIQEETTILGVPCVTIRENTERPVTITRGTNRLGGTTPESIRGAIEAAMRSSGASNEPPELWDGHAAERIAVVIDSWAKGR